MISRAPEGFRSKPALCQVERHLAEDAVRRAARERAEVAAAVEAGMARLEEELTVRALPQRSSALRVSHSESGFV